MAKSIIPFNDGQELLDFLFMKSNAAKRVSGQSYFLIMDIELGKIAGPEVLEQIKQDAELKKIPVVMFGSGNSAEQIEKCQTTGCSIYIHRRTDDEDFIESMTKLGLFLSIVQAPEVNGSE